MNYKQNKKVIYGFQESFENDQKSFKKVISRIIRLLCPIFVPFVWLLAVSIANKADFELVGVIIFLSIYLGVIIPIYCFVYGLNVLKNENDKDFFALCNPVLLSLSCFFFGFLTRSAFIHILLFGWFSIWTFLPIWIHNSIIKKLNKKNDCEESIDVDDVVIIRSNTADRKNKSIKENSKEYYSEALILQREYSIQMKRSIWKTIRIVMPFYFSWILFALNEFMEIENFFVMFIIFPVSCFIYGWSVAKCEKRKYFFALYYPVVSLMNCIQFSFGINDEHYVLPIIASLFFCTLLPVWIYNARNKPKAKDESGSESDRGQKPLKK